MEPTPKSILNSESIQATYPDLPAELQGWNWGAFFFSWLWAIPNNTYIGLLAFIPGINFIMPFVLGAKGNEWAWKNRRFESIQQFKSVQNTWAGWGLALFTIIVIGFVGIFYLAVSF